MFFFVILFCYNVTRLMKTYCSDSIDLNHRRSKKVILTHNNKCFDSVCDCVEK